MARKDLVKALLDTYGLTFCDELGIAIAKNQPAPLFQLLCASMLYSARISANNATQAIKALFNQGLTNAEHMAASTWQERVDIITKHGYKRYDERTSTLLGELAERAQTKYHGDLRRLREEAERDLHEEKNNLMEFKGIGPVGADIFLREVQVVWDEAYPYVDDKLLAAAERLELGSNAEALARLVTKKDFARFTAALVRVAHDDGFERVRDSARAVHVAR